jgi:TrmH family RNA methyltransferase
VLGSRNPKVKELRRLASSRRSRVTAGRFVVEGPTLVQELLDSDVGVVDVFHEPGADPVLVARAALVADVHEVLEGVLDAAGDAVTSQGVVAVATTPTHQLSTVTDAAPVFVLDDVADPGNAGTLVRVAEACGFAAVLFTAGSVDPWSPKTVRASAGSVLRVPVITTGEGASVLDELRAGGRRCIGTRATDAPAYSEVTFPPSTAIILGNEAHGLSPSVYEHVDGWVRIPMAGQVESLNVAVAGSVLAFEVRRQLTAAGIDDG